MTSYQMTDVMDMVIWSSQRTMSGTYSMTNNIIPIWEHDSNMGTQLNFPYWRANTNMGKFPYRALYGKKFPYRKRPIHSYWQISHIGRLHRANTSNSNMGKKNPYRTPIWEFLVPSDVNSGFEMSFVALKNCA